jgi:hypothetical protein
MIWKLATFVIIYLICIQSFPTFNIPNYQHEKSHIRIRTRYLHQQLPKRKQKMEAAVQKAL